MPCCLVCAATAAPAPARTHHRGGVPCSIEDHILWAVLAASFIGPFTVAAFFAFGTLVLLKKTVSESGVTYSYGALHWSALWMAVVVLQARACAGCPAERATGGACSGCAAPLAHHTSWAP